MNCVYIYHCSQMFVTMLRYIGKMCLGTCGPSSSFLGCVSFPWALASTSQPLDLRALSNNYCNIKLDVCLGIPCLCSVVRVI